MQSDVEKLEQPVSVHEAQAKVYGYIYMVQNHLSGIDVQMTYANPETEKIKRFTKEESKIIGYMYKFKLTLHPVLHQLIHNTGLGDKVNLGFGCIEILE